MSRARLPAEDVTTAMTPAPIKPTGPLLGRRLSESKQVKAPGWFTLVALLAVIWNGAGVAAFSSDFFLPEFKQAAMPEAQRALYLSTPAWAWTAYALAVGCGLLGSLALLARRSISVALFLVSLLALLVQMFHAFFLARAAAALGPSSMIVPGLIVVIAVYLLVLATQARNHRWTR
jgi:hypothetical protein